MSISVMQTSVRSSISTRLRAHLHSEDRNVLVKPASLWQQYLDGCMIARDRLLEHHLGLVHHIARQMVRSLGPTVDLDDLISSGTNGLMLALQRFEPSRGIAFSTFAAPRIRGAILDDLRKNDTVSRLARQRSRAITRAKDTLETKLHRTPTEDEVAALLGIPSSALWRWKSDVENNKLISLDRHTQMDQSYSDVSGLSEVELIADERASTIEDELNTEMTIKFLRDAIQELKEQDRIVLSLCYFENLSSVQIAAVLGVSESRISQIRARALEQLREKVGAIRSYMV